MADRTPTLTATARRMRLNAARCREWASSSPAEEAAAYRDLAAALDHSASEIEAVCRYKGW